LHPDDHAAYGRLVAPGAGIGFLAQCSLRRWPGIVPVLPVLKIPPLPCWLAVHREIRASCVVRRVFDFLAEEVPLELGVWCALAQAARASCSMRAFWLAIDCTQRTATSGVLR
jgi:hypothetical protein